MKRLISKTQCLGERSLRWWLPLETHVEMWKIDTKSDEFYIAASRPLNHAALKVSNAYTVDASYTIEDYSGKGHSDSVNEKTEIILIEASSGAIATLAAASGAILITLFF